MKMSFFQRILSLGFIIGSLVGCAANCPIPVPEPAIGIPERKLLIGLSQEQWESLRPDIQDVYSHDVLSFQEMIRRLEGRIRAHDESLNE